MKKKILGLLSGGIMAFSLFVAPGNVVEAAKPGTQCDCPFDFVTGAERNKIVAELISSEEFKNKKIELMNQGYNWYGATTLQVLYLGENKAVLVPFFQSDGSGVGAFFVNGNFDTEMPLDPHSH